MMSREFHKFWLKITAIVVGAFGPIFFLGSMTSTLEPARLTLDLLSWPIDGATTFASPDTRFLSAVTGGFLLGWGVMIWCLSTWVYAGGGAPLATREGMSSGRAVTFSSGGAVGRAAGPARWADTPAGVPG